MEITLCGNPQPKLFYTFHGKTKSAKMIEKLNELKQMYKYQIDLENVKRRDCGSTLQFNAVSDLTKEWKFDSTVLVKCETNHIY